VPGPESVPGSESVAAPESVPAPAAGPSAVIGAVTSTLSRGGLLALLADAVGVRSAGRPVRVAIDGSPSSGKTTMADELAGVLRRRGRPVIRACVDDFHLPRDERYWRDQYTGRGCYQDSFDYSALRGLLLDPLGPGGTLEYRTVLADGQTDRTSGLTKAPADAVLLLDGVFLLRPELRDRWDLTIHLSVQPSEILRRARIRDLDLLGSIEEVDRRYLSRYLPAQELYHADDDPIDQADFIVVNDDPETPIVRIGIPGRDGNASPTRAH
jgi:uridine kinase